MHGRVDIGEGELVGRDLAVGMHVPLAEEEGQLLLCKMRVHLREGDHVEGQVPSRVPGILPLIRHRDDVPVVEVRPVGIPATQAIRGWRWERWISFQPVFDGIVEKLLAPEEARVSLPCHSPLFLRRTCRNLSRVEFIGLLYPFLERLVKLLADRLVRRLGFGAETKTNARLLTGRDLKPVVALPGSPPGPGVPEPEGRQEM